MVLTHKKACTQNAKDHPSDYEISWLDRVSMEVLRLDQDAWRPGIAQSPNLINTIMLS